MSADSAIVADNSKPTSASSDGHLADHPKRTKSKPPGPPSPSPPPPVRVLVSVDGMTCVGGIIQVLVWFSNSGEPELMPLPVMQKLYLNELLLFYESHVTLVDAPQS
jgi:hypothetical protein